MGEVSCPRCNRGDMIIKRGKRESIKGEKQRYMCQRCNMRFVMKGKYTAYYKDEIVELALKLHKNGMSSHSISEYLRGTQNVKVSNSTISSWIKSFKSKE